MRSSRKDSARNGPSLRSELRRTRSFYQSSTSDRRPLFVLRERLEDHLAQLVLRRNVDHGPQQGKAASLAVDAVGPRRECDVSPTAAAAFPHGESDELQALERSVAG